MLSQAQWLTFFRLSKHSQKKCLPKTNSLYYRRSTGSALWTPPPSTRTPSKRATPTEPWFWNPNTPQPKILDFWGANLQNLKTQRLEPQIRLLAGTLENLPGKKEPWKSEKGPKPAPHSGCVTYELSRNHHTIAFCLQMCDDWVIITGSSYDHV